MTQIRGYLVVSGDTFFSLQIVTYFLVKKKNI